MHHCALIVDDKLAGLDELDRSSALADVADQLALKSEPAGSLS